MPRPPATVPPDLRLYAIGDIHGRFDLLQTLLQKIEADAVSCHGQVKRIFLGDYIDRGPFSRHVIEHIMALQAEDPANTIFLRGNHEHTLTELLRTEDTELLGNWLHFGGRETLLSYGARPPLLPWKGNSFIPEIIDAIPAAHIAFLESLPTSIGIGDYFFCHAGVRPGVALEQQTLEDLIWIRADFLSHKKPFDKIIVHGHTICEQVEILSNRINIDTGAYATGCLTALALEGNRQWIIQTG